MVKIQVNTASQIRNHSEQKAISLEANGGGQALTKRIQKLFTKAAIPTLYFFTDDGKELDGDGVDGPFIIDLQAGACVHYAKEQMDGAWAKLLLETPLPADVASYTGFYGWFSELDDLNTRWRVVLTDWEVDWWKLPVEADKAVTELFENLANLQFGPTTGSPIQANILEATNLVKRCEKVINFNDFIPETIPFFLPSIRGSLLDMNNRKSTGTGSEMDFTRKLYSRLLDPFFPPNGFVEQFSTKKLEDEAALPDFRLDLSLTFAINIAILYTEDASAAMKQCAVEHKDWKKLMEIMRRGAKQQVVDYRIPIDQARTFGILFGAATCCFATITVVKYESDEDGPTLGFRASLGKVLKLYDSSDVVGFYKMLAKIRAHITKLPPNVQKEQEATWATSGEKLVGPARVQKDSLVIKELKSGHYYPKASFSALKTNGKKRSRRSEEEGGEGGDGGDGGDVDDVGLN